MKIAIFRYNKKKKKRKKKISNKNITIRLDASKWYDFVTNHLFFINIYI